MPKHPQRPPSRGQISEAWDNYQHRDRWAGGSMPNMTIDLESYRRIERSDRALALGPEPVKHNHGPGPHPLSPDNELVNPHQRPDSPAEQRGVAALGRRPGRRSHAMMDADYGRMPGFSQPFAKDPSTGIRISTTSGDPHPRPRLPGEPSSLSRLPRIYGTEGSVGRRQYFSDAAAVMVGGRPAHGLALPRKTGGRPRKSNGSDG